MVENNCFGYFDERDDYCWYICPWSIECEYETFCACKCPSCYGYFDDWDDYCWNVCPYSCSCEKATWGSCSY